VRVQREFYDATQKFLIKAGAASGIVIPAGMLYVRQQSVFGKGVLTYQTPEAGTVSIASQAIFDTIDVQWYVICAEAKHANMGMGKCIRAVGDLGIVRTKKPKNCRRPFYVEWTGKDKDGNELTESGSKGWTKCQISEYADPIKQQLLRRRLAQREFSNKRDSPVMTRLLKEIIEANQRANDRD